MAQGIHAGHRERMRKKLISFGGDIFNDHELLEMLLFSAIPLKNTNPIAIELIRRFKGLEGVLTASREELMSVEGIGERAADLIRSVGAVEMSAESFCEAPCGPCFDDWSFAGKYLVNYFDGTTEYKTVLLLLNNSMEYLDVRQMTDTDYSSAAIKAKSFLDAALSVGASVAIVAHNHPYGPCIPSMGDLETNAMISTAFASAGLLLVEHFIILGDKFIGIMNPNKRAFPVSTAVYRFASSREDPK